jgi:poly(3-hydroxybutyrate) depolymerase
MAYRLAVDLADRIAAAGIVNGSLGIKSADGTPCLPDVPKPVAPISIIQISGQKDGVVKFAGGQTPKNLYKSATDCIQFFVQADGCATSGQETRDAEHGVVRTLYSKGKGGTEVELIVVENCNHNWPFPPVGLSASQELWDFFSKHPKAAR